MILIVDYGVGNTGSIQNILKRVGFESIISSDPEHILKADKLILPGVGAFDNAMHRINNSDLRKILDEAVLKRKIPVLGICLGMQIMCKSSEEGKNSGLGWIDAEVKRFDFSHLQKRPKVPNMGWSHIEILKESRIFPNTHEGQRFYFVHSFFVKCHDKSDILAESQHGFRFHAAFERDNIFGVQFHPEKSHRFGMSLMAAYAKF